MTRPSINTNDTEAMFLDYFNNFTTVAAFAEHYELSTEAAWEIILEGRSINLNDE